MKTNDQVNPDAAKGIPSQTTESGGSGSTPCSALLSGPCTTIWPEGVTMESLGFCTAADTAAATAQYLRDKNKQLGFQLQTIAMGNGLMLTEGW